MKLRHLIVTGLIALSLGFVFADQSLAKPCPLTVKGCCAEKCMDKCECTCCKKCECCRKNECCDKKMKHKK